MSFAPSSPVTGGPQTGLTSPTYTLTADTAPDSNGKQYAITALGGTQTGVIAHAVSSPFTVTFVRPKVTKALPLPDVNNVLRSVPRNTYFLLTRKAVLPLAGQSYATMTIRTEISVPAGADTADSANVRAGLSLHIGTLWQVSAGIGDTTINAVL
jgi:hypothetical protein